MRINSNKKSKTRRRFIIESVAIFLIIASPFIYKIHVYFSEDPESTISLFGYIVDNNGFPDLSTYVWFLMSKIVPIYLLAIWFFTCKHWWYHIILIPLCMYTFQLFEVIYSEDEFIDTDNVMWLLPICMVVIPFVYFIRVKLYDKYVHGIDLEAMDAELESFKEREKQDHLSPADTPENSTDRIDLSEKVSKRTLSKIFKQFQHSLKNLFNISL
ncbi:MAG: hypothetical protein KJO16_06600 [Muriicola sp.]|nr:hypothetical protein [Muriicola sp.]NNK10967.1 hypothetical protein [Flavobacteriaceae bacterium]